MSKKFPPTQFKKNRFSGFKTVKNSVGGKFFKIFSRVIPRSTNQGASIELSFAKIDNVRASEKEVQSH